MIYKATSTTLPALQFFQSSSWRTFRRRTADFSPRPAVFIAALLLIACASPQARRDQFVAKGKQYMAQRDYPRAVLEFRNAARVKPWDADVQYQSGMAYAATGD